MKIKIYYHDEIISPAFSEESDTLPDELLLDGSHHRLVWKGSAGDLNLSESEDDQRLLESLFSMSGDTRLPDFLDERYRPLSYGDVVLIDKRAYICRTADWLGLEAFPLAAPKSAGEFRLLEKLLEMVRIWQEREFAAQDAAENHEDGSPDWTIFVERRSIYKQCGEELKIALARHHTEMLRKANIESEKNSEDFAERLKMKNPDRIADN